MVRLVSAVVVVASVALLAASCGGGTNGASETRATTAASPRPRITPSWTQIGGIRLNTFRSTVVRIHGRGVKKYGEAYDYTVGRSTLTVLFEHGRVKTIRTWDPIVALPDGVRIGPGSALFPMGWRSVTPGYTWKGYRQLPPTEGLERSGEWVKIVRRPNGSGILVWVDLGGPHGEPGMIDLTWVAPGYELADVLPDP